MLDASKEFKSNQLSSYSMLSAVSQSVPGGVWFTVITFDSPNSLIIKGDAANDQVIVNFIDRLQALPMIEQASLQNMTLNTVHSSASRRGGGAKQFEVRCIVTTPAQRIVVPNSISPPGSSPSSSQTNRPAQTI